MPQIIEISDGGSNPNTPSGAEMRESQRKGSVGKGTQSQDYSDMESNFNMGTGKGVGGDKPSYPRASNDDNVAEFPAANSEQPWE